MASPRTTVTRQDDQDDKALPGLAGELWQLIVSCLK